MIADAATSTAIPAAAAAASTGRRLAGPPGAAFGWVAAGGVARCFAPGPGLGPRPGSDPCGGAGGGTARATGMGRETPLAPGCDPNVASSPCLPPVPVPSWLAGRDPG